MTDRPTLEDLDAAPDDGPWCCNGNAEDCALCAQQGFDMLAYPWICPGHERTVANERIVGEATQATEPGTFREVRILVQAPTSENAGQWAETIRDLVVGEYGDSMRLEVTIRPGGRS